MAHGTHDCAPTLTDSQVLEFCKYGHLMLEGVVAEEINARCRRWLDDHHAGDGPAELQELLEQECFYYPADSPVESGPTEFVPGSHHVYNQVRFMAHYGEIGGTWKAVAPAGSIYLTAYSLWHRRARATWDGVRYMVTSSAWRTRPPRRDWVPEPDFSIKSADYTSTAPRFGEQVRGAHDNARMFLWLCGRAEEFQPAAGPSWPQSTPGNRARYGAPGDRPRR